MPQSIRHVVFTPSGAGSVRQALKAARRDDDVVSLFDDLSFGPINPPDPSMRAKWVESELGYSEWNDIVSQSESFWQESLSTDSRKIVWTSRRNTAEFTGFLEWLRRASDSSFELIDLTDQEIVSPIDYGPPNRPWLALGLGELSADAIRYNNLLDQSRVVTSSDRNEYRRLWQRLQMEDAPLRVLKSGALVSAPISFFDSRLMSFMTSEWQSMARVVAEAMVAQMDENICQTGDLVLAARIRSMVDSGLVETQGNYFELQNCRVRLP